MELDEILINLLELGKKNQGYVYSKDVLKYCSDFC